MQRTYENVLLAIVLHVVNILNYLKMSKRVDVIILRRVTKRRNNFIRHEKTPEASSLSEKHFNNRYDAALLLL